jgi:hypothetical protein
MTARLLTKLNHARIGNIIPIFADPLAATTVAINKEVDPYIATKEQTGTYPLLVIPGRKPKPTARPKPQLVWAGCDTVKIPRHRYVASIGLGLILGSGICLALLFWIL